MIKFCHNDNAGPFLWQFKLVASYSCPLHISKDLCLTLHDLEVEQLASYMSSLPTDLINFVSSFLEIIGTVLDNLKQPYNLQSCKTILNNDVIPESDLEMFS